VILKKLNECFVRDDDLYVYGGFSLLGGFDTVRGWDGNDRFVVSILGREYFGNFREMACQAPDPLYLDAVRCHKRRCGSV
jgi:hypothetical protein